MKKSIRVAMAIVCFAIAIAIALGALWWWAIKDMNPRIGAAYMITIFLFAVGGVVILESKERR